MGASPFACPNCGVVHTPGMVVCSPTNAVSPRELCHGRYRLITALRETPGGALYVAEDSELGNRRVVIKELRLADVAAEDRQEAASLFQQEALLLGGLHHASLPGIYEQFNEEGNEYLVREYVEGQTLAEYLDHLPRGRLSTPETLDLALRLAEVLEYLHTGRPPMLLGNLNPSHILLAPDGQVFLIDVRPVRQDMPGKPNPVQAPGTSRYAAPEQRQGVPSGASDQYALALILAEALCGGRSSSRSGDKRGGDPFVTPAHIFSDPGLSLEPAVEGVLRKALSRQPQDRYPTIRAFADAFFQASRNSSIRLPSGYSMATTPGAQPLRPASLTPVQAPTRPQRWKPWLIPLLVIVVLGGSVAGIFAIARVFEQAVINTYSFPPVRPTATPDLNVYYLAEVPGPGCDTHGGMWQSESSSTQVSCSASGMKISQPINAPYIAEVFFDGPQSGDFTFPQNYTTSVQVSQLENQDTCAGVMTREQQDGAGGYSFLVCGDGTWTIFQYDQTTGYSSRLATGKINRATSYLLQVIGKDSTQRFSVNGANEVDLTDRTYLSTSSLGLVVDTGAAAAGGSAIFSTFVFSTRPL